MHLKTVVRKVLYGDICEIIRNKTRKFSYHNYLTLSVPKVIDIREAWYRSNPQTFRITSITLFWAFSYCVFKNCLPCWIFSHFPATSTQYSLNSVFDELILIVLTLKNAHRILFGTPVTKAKAELRWFFERG